MPEQKYPEPICGALIFNPENKVFLMRSGKWKGNYVIPGGHVELGEKLEDALKREVKEETGLSIHDISFLRFDEFIFEKGCSKKKHFIFFNFVCKTNSSKVKLNSEGYDSVWVSINEALKLPLEKHTRKTIEHYLKTNSK
jgi:nucleoside triphosphatase